MELISKIGGWGLGFICKLVIPVISDLLEDLHRSSACSVICAVPVVDHKISEVHPQTNHEDIHNNPNYQSRHLSKSIY